VLPRWQGVRPDDPPLDSGQSLRQELRHWQVPHEHAAHPLDDPSVSDGDPLVE